MARQRTPKTRAPGNSPRRPRTAESIAKAEASRRKTEEAEFWAKANRILSVIDVGTSEASAEKLAGVKHRTHSAWKTTARQVLRRVADGGEPVQPSEQRYVDYFAKYEEALGKIEARAMTVVQTIMLGAQDEGVQLKAATWTLTHHPRMRDIYAEKHKLEHTGPGGSNVAMRIILSDPSEPDPHLDA